MRVLVDRLWTRGMSKDRVAADLWLKDAAPSAALRRWYGHDTQRWEAFSARYRVELQEHEDILSLLFELSRNGRVTLLFDAHDPTRNNAVVLRDVLHEMSAA